MKYQLVRDHRDRCPVRRMCRMLDVSPSAYCSWLRHPESRREREDRRPLVEVKAIYQAKRGTYGSPRIHAEIKTLGQYHGLKRVARLMRENDIRARQKRKLKVTIDSKHSHPVAPNLLHHSDRGSQYSCGGYQKALQTHGMTHGISRKGDCCDTPSWRASFTPAKRNWRITETTGFARKPRRIFLRTSGSSTTATADTRPWASAPQRNMIRLAA